MDKTFPQKGEKRPKTKCFKNKTQLDHFSCVLSFFLLCASSKQQAERREKDAFMWFCALGPPAPVCLAEVQAVPVDL